VSEAARPSSDPSDDPSSSRSDDASGSASSNPSSNRSRLVVLAGPTAVGKGTVAAAVRAEHPDVWISVWAATL
jgi:guanylate kinase